MSMKSKTEVLLDLVDPITTRYLAGGIEVLQEDELVFLSVWMLEAEVNNGGFDQFYFNSTGEMAKESVNSLQKIGAQATANIVAAANGQFGEDGPPENWDERQLMLEKLVESSGIDFEPLDLAFYEYPDDLEALLFSFVEKSELGKRI